MTITACMKQKCKNISSNETELSNYCSSPRAPKDTDILEWWKHHEYIYPTLAAMERDFLRIQATSVPCERVFSEAGNVVTKTRCLSKDKIRASICINLRVKSLLKNKICDVNI